MAADVAGIWAWPGLARTELAKLQALPFKLQPSTETHLELDPGYQPRAIDTTRQPHRMHIVAEKHRQRNCLKFLRQIVAVATVDVVAVESEIEVEIEKSKLKMKMGYNCQGRRRRSSSSAAGRSWLGSQRSAKAERRCYKCTGTEQK